MKKIEGIILRTTEYKETSRILHILTIEGKKSVIIKGCKKLNNKYRFFCYPINKINYTSSNSKLPCLIDGDLVFDYPLIKEDLTANLYANHLLELAYYATDSDIDYQRLYPFLDKCLRKINEGINPLVISFIFELKLLYLLGVNPNFKTCRCNNTTPYGFSFSDGSIRCQYCSHEASPALKEIIELYYINLDTDLIREYDNITLKNIRSFIDTYYSYYVPIKTKSHQFF